VWGRPSIASASSFSPAARMRDVSQRFRKSWFIPLLTQMLTREGERKIVPESYRALAGRLYLIRLRPGLRVSSCGELLI
jgi:hypothetical protein